MKNLKFDLQLFAEGVDISKIGEEFATFMLKKTEKGYPALGDTEMLDPDTVGSEAPSAYLTENWTIESADGLKLSGVHYAPENPKGQWIVLVTGYGQVGATMNYPASILLGGDYDVLVIDPRTSGSSEGDWLTMGVAESVDLALWTQKIAETNSNAQITLFGVSMGAATVMMAAALSQTTNVTAIIEDCGYANVYSVFEKVANLYAADFGWTGTNEELFEKVTEATKTLTGYNVADAVALNSVPNVTVPSLFIHGTADTLVSVEDAQALYDASGAKDKDLFTVEGAGHAKSITTSPFLYGLKAIEFIQKSNKEIGADIIAKDADKLVRGTIYDDTITATGKNITIDGISGNDVVTYSEKANIKFDYTKAFADGNDVVLENKNNSLTILNAKDETIIINGSETVISDENVIVNGESDKTITLNDTEIIRNSGDNVTIKGAGNNQVKRNSGSNVLVEFDSGNNYVSNIAGSKNNTLITGDGDDTFGNGGESALIKSGGGNDSVTNNASDVTIDAGAGNDSISLFGNVTESKEEGGENTVTGANISVNADEGDDYISINHSYNNTIQTGAGDDSVVVTKGSKENISTGDGNDSIIGTIGSGKKDWAFGAGATIDAGAGDDYIAPFYTDGSSINGGDGNDTIINNGENTTIDGGAGDDYIELTNNYKKETGEFETATIIAGVGDDTIVGINENANIQADVKNATIEGNNVILTTEDGTITVEDGKDKGFFINGESFTNGFDALNIENDTPDTVIVGTAYDDTVTNNAENVTIDTRAGDDVILSNDVNNVSIVSGDGNDVISVVGQNEDCSIITADAGEGNNYVRIYNNYHDTIKTGSGDDTVEVSKGSYINVSTGDGNDNIIGIFSDETYSAEDKETWTPEEIESIDPKNWSFGGYAVIDAGAGNDYISPYYSDSSSIYGGDGDDTIINNGANTTIDGGEGNDLIELTNNIKKVPGGFEPTTIVATAGDDTIKGYNENAYIQGKFNGAKLDGNDVIFINGSNSVKVIGAKDQVVKFVDSEGNQTESIISSDVSIDDYPVVNGESIVIDGVKYTAVSEDAVLGGSDGSVVGIKSGKFEATIADAKTTPEITLDGTTAFDFTAKAENGELSITLADGSTIDYLSGAVTYDANGILAPEGELQIQLNRNEVFAQKGNTITVDVPVDGFYIPHDKNLPVDLNFSDSLKLKFDAVGAEFSFNGSLSYDRNERSLKFVEGAAFGANIPYNNRNFEIKALKESEIVFGGTTPETTITVKEGSSFNMSGSSSGIQGDITVINGEMSFDISSVFEKENSSSINLEDGTSITINSNGSKAPITVSVTEDTAVTFTTDETAQTVTISSDAKSGINLSSAAISNLEMNVKGDIVVSTKDNTITHGEDSVTTYKIKNDDQIVFAATMTVNDGGLSFNIANGKFSLAENSNIEIGIVGRDYNFKLTNTDVAGGSFKFDENGITIAPDSGDGTLNIEVSKGDQGGKLNLDFKSGSVTLNNQNEISLAAGTELAINFSDDYSIGLKATDTAGGKIEVVEGGIQFTPNEGDGKLEITVTNGDTVRTATLELTGAVTFALDGTISLAKDSVMDITFEDGENLKIISNEDASGTIKFGGTEGVTITPANPTALTVAVTSPNYADIRLSYTDMTGSITYSGGNIILSDETSLIYRVYYGDSVLSERTASTSGGTSTLGMSATDRSYTPSEGAILTDMDNNSGHGVVISKGNLSQYMSGVRYISKITEGTIVNANSDTNFILEKAGEYTLNGEKITTTEDNVEVKLVDWNAIEFDASAGLTVDGEEYTGDEGTIVKVTKDGEDENVSLVMYKKGNVHVNGEGHSVDLELTEDDENGIIITSDEDGFTVSHLMTAEEVESYGDPKSFIGKYFDEKVTISDKTYSIELYTEGIDKIKNVSGGATITALATVKDENYENGTWFYVVTETEGEFTFGENTVTISGDDSVVLDLVFDKNGDGTVYEIDDLNGTFEGKVDEELAINSTNVTLSAVPENLKVLADGENILIGVLKENATITTDKNNVMVDTSATELTLNDVTYKVDSESNSILIGANEVSGLDPKSKLTISKAGTYTVNGTKLKVKDDDIIIGVSSDYAYIYNPDSPNFNSDDTTKEILEKLGIDEDDVTEVDEYETTLPNVKASTAVIPEDTEGETKVTMGNKGSVVIVENTDKKTPVIIGGGKGNDTVITKGEDVTFDMAAGGKDQVTALDGKVTMDNYNPDTKAGIKLTDEQAAKGVTFDTGKVVLEGAEVDFSVGKDVDNFVNLYTPDDKELRVGFATEDNNVVDASNSKKDMVLIGSNEHEKMSLANEIEYASLLGGSGNDSIFAGAGAYVDAGAGKNYVKMSDEGGATINFAEGKTTIDNFNFVDDNEDTESDKLQTGKLAINGVKVSDGDVVLKTKKGDITINDAENKTIAIENDATDGVVNMTVSKDEVNVVDNGYYVAANKNATVSLEDYTGDTANVNLNNNNFNEKDALTFYGDIKEIDASGYENAATLVGNDKNNVLKAGDGGTLLNGGKGNNTLIGADDVADTFVTGEGNDLIKNFVAGVGEDSDKISLTGGLDTVEVRGNDVILIVGNSRTTVEGLKDQTFQLANEATNNEIIAMQISDKELNVDENGYYVASGKDAKVSLKDYTGGSAVANLGDSNYNNGGLSFYGDIKTLDATGYQGNAVLGGNSNSNNIIAGEGNNTLWGGIEGNDTLIGGDGADLFIYGKGNSNDVVQNADEKDTVKLVGIALEDIIVRDENIFSGNDVIFRINDGGTLTVKDGKTSGATYNVDGVQYVINDGKFENK